MQANLTLRQCIHLAGIFALLLWVVKAFESAFGVSLSGLGVYPQDAGGLFGILTAPLVHSSWQHLMSNTLPILLLGSMLIYGYPKSSWRVVVIVWLASGLGVWFFARPSFHIGASGLTHGMFFFLFMAGIIRRDKKSSVLLMVASFMYGTMLWTIFPLEPGISFEYHFFGALSGTACAILFRHSDPKPVVKKYPWEVQDSFDEEDDPIIGDQWKLPEAAQAELDKAISNQISKEF